MHRSLCRHAPLWPRVVLALALVVGSAGFAPRLAAQSVPTFAEVSGHAFGERITVHAEMVRYLERLAEVSDRVQMIDQGASWEGRALLVAVVTSRENHARLDEIRANAQALADPRALDAESAAQIIESQPAIVWLGGSIHGFELSGSEGLLKLLERLSTADDEATLKALDQTVVLIDPMLNPDGRDAFAHFNHARLGGDPNPHPNDWSNDFTSWEALGFRTGHYFFDTNRDWFAQTQLETRRRAPTWLQWRPQVIVDAHEMGADMEFFFDPPTEPVSPLYPAFSSRWHEIFGAAYAEAFDTAGFEYTTRDLFNYFYPGYSTAWGSYQGAVGLLFEQGSSRGLALTRGDGTTRTLLNATEQQYEASWTTVRTAAERRQELLQEYYQSHREALADGAQGVRRYLLSGDSDPYLLAEAVGLLKRNGIEVHRLTEDVRLSGVRDRIGGETGEHTFAAGTFVIEAAQPRSRLVRNLLEPSVETPAEFLAAARERIDRGEGARFYDMTAWSLPLLFNLDGYSSTDGRTLPAEHVDTGSRVVQDMPTPRYAYVLPGDQTASIAAAWHLRRQGYRVMVTGPTATRVAGQDIPGGSVVVRVRQEAEPQTAALPAAIRDLSRRYRLRVLGLDTGRPDGPSHLALGSRETVRLRPGQVGLLAEEPFSGYSFGWAWYTLERQYGIPTLVLRSRSLAERSLEDIEVLVIPDTFGSPARVLGEGGMDRLRRWVRDGGTLIALGGAVEFVRNDLELIQLRSWYPDPSGDSGPDGEDAEQPRRFTVPGAFLNGQLDTSSWLTAGYQDEQLPFLVFSSRIYQAPSGPPNGGRRAVVTFPQADEGELVLAGHTWDESDERLPGAVGVYVESVGAGRVVAFAEDPNFRGYWRGADRLFLNAVVLGPSGP